MALIRKNLVIPDSANGIKVSEQSIRVISAPGKNGILLGLAARPWPFTLDPSTGLATNTIIKMYASDGGGVEILGTDSQADDKISMNLDHGYVFEHVDRAEILSAMEIVRFLDAPSGTGALGVFINGLTLYFTGDDNNPHNVELQVELLEFNDPLT